MSMYNYGIGGNEVAKDTGEGISEIPANKTLFIQKLTKEAPITPQIVTGLQNVEAAFEHFQPSVAVTFQDAQGVEVQEEVSFKNIADFTPKSIKKNSVFLNKLDTQQQQNVKIVKQLTSNKALKKAIDTSQTRSALIDVLQVALNEIKSVEK